MRDAKETTEPREPRVRSAVRDRLLTAALFAVIIVIGGLTTQCRMVTDAVTAAGSSEFDKKNGPATCASLCAKAFEDSIRVEDALHDRNEENCDDETCDKIEDARHKAALARIRAGRKQCQNDCHDQGGGKGGR
jgi:hypothetical protein